MADAATDLMQMDKVEVDLAEVPGAENLIVDEPLEYGDDDPNLVPIFRGNKDGEEALKNLSLAITSVFDESWSATEEFRERQAKDWRMFACELPPKSWPWKNSA